MTGLSRRAAMIGGLAAPVVAWAAPSAGATVTERLTGRPAAGFVDSVGICVHLSYTDTPYADAAAVQRALVGLGVRHVRDDLRLDRPDQWAALNLLAGSGIGADLITGSPGEAPPAAYVATAARELRLVDALEGTNEWDLRGPRDTWAQEAHQRQAQLFAAARAEPRTAGIPVLGPAPAFWYHLPELAQAGPLGAVSDVANLHAYGNGRSLGMVLDDLRAVVAAHQPGQAVAITETGWHNALRSVGDHRPVTEQAAAGLVTVSLLQAFAAGVARTYLYELIDEFVDPLRVSAEASFGLLRRDLSAKPAHAALRLLLGLATDPGPATPGSLTCTLTGPDDLRRLVLQRSDGTQLLALWRDVPPPTTQTTRPAAARMVTVSLPTRRPVRVYPLLGGDQPAADTTTNRLSVAVGEVPVVVALGGRRSTDLRRSAS